MKGQYAGGLRAEVARTIGGRKVPMHLFVVDIVGGRDFSQEPRDHLNDIRDRHGADFVLAFLSPLPWGLRIPLRLGMVFLVGEALNMGQISDFDAIGRANL